MAMIPAVERNLKASANTARALLALYGELSIQDTLYAGAANYDAAITDEALGQSGAFQGLTAQAVADAEYAKATILSTLQNALPALSILAQY